jgi:hypothetical protein
MTLLIEVGMWLGAGLLAAVALAHRNLALASLAACGSALSFAALARIATDTPWQNGEVHVLGLVAAAIGAVLGALALRALADASPFSRGPRSHG